MEKNEALLENLKDDVQSQDWTYDPKYHNRRMVKNVIENFIFTNRPTVLVSLFYSCFSKNITNNRSFLSIRDYGASRELYEKAL